MTTTRVWIQLYYEGKGEPVGDPTRVNVAADADGAVVDDLKNEVMKARSKKLTHCDAGDLTVYKPDSTVPVLERADALDPGDGVPEGTSSKSPLIVVAPQQQLQQQQHQQVSFLGCLDDVAFGCFHFDCYCQSQRLTSIVIATAAAAACY
jgi:hypothetical protein